MMDRNFMPYLAASLPAVLAALISALFTFTAPLHADGIEFEFSGASSAPLGNPHDLKLSADGALLYVADVDNDRITVLDPHSLKQVGVFGEGEQDGTHDIDFDRHGNAYVADTHNNRILVYRVTGLTATLSGEISQGIRGPEGVLAHPNGRIYVAGAWSGNVVAYEDGEIVAELRGLSSPHDLELAADAGIWLADAGNDRMLLLSPQLEILREYSGPRYAFDGVRYLDVLPDGTVIAADKYSHSVKVISPDGALLHVLGSGRPGKGPGLFTTPEGVETMNNTLWISDSGNDRVVKYSFRLP